MTLEVHVLSEFETNSFNKCTITKKTSRKDVWAYGRLTVQNLSKNPKASFGLGKVGGMHIYGG